VKAREGENEPADRSRKGKTEKGIEVRKAARSEKKERKRRRSRSTAKRGKTEVESPRG